MARKTTPKTERLINELRKWCDAPPPYGKRKKAAEMLGINSQTITNWLAGTQNPTSEQVLNLQDFLRKQSKRRKRRKNQKQADKAQKPPTESAAAESAEQPAEPAETAAESAAKRYGISL